MGFFGRKKVEVPPHPRREPRIDLPLTVESVRQVFADCVDFSEREAALGGDPDKLVTLCYISGMVKMERAHPERRPLQFRGGKTRHDGRGRIRYDWRELHPLFSRGKGGPLL